MQTVHILCEPFFSIKRHLGSVNKKINVDLKKRRTTMAMNIFTSFNVRMSGIEIVYLSIIENVSQ